MLYLASSRRWIIALVYFSVSLHVIADIDPPQWEERSDWAHFFNEANVEGTIAIVDLRDGNDNHYVYNASRAEQRLTPASTFKIPHSLFLLDAGLLRDEFQVIRWDGVDHGSKRWNQDQTLRSMMRHSALWVYQKLAKEMGSVREKRYLKRTGYGNGEISDNLEWFWVDGSLRISALEQLEFLQRLYRNDLPFDTDDQRLVKDVMINEASAAEGWILRAKTGWGVPEDEPQVGWWVGWVEHLDGPVFFALNIEIVDSKEDPSKREKIVRNILRSLKVI